MERPPLRGRNLLKIAIVFYPAMAGVAFLLAWLMDVPSLWEMPPEVPRRIPPWTGLVLGAAFGLTAYGLGELARRRFRWAQDFYEAIAELVGSLSVWEALAAALLSALGEELLFRGALLPIVGLFPQAVIFGAVHYAPSRRMRWWPLYAAVVGTSLGLLYQLSGTLFAPIIAHFTVNFLGLSALGDEVTSSIASR